MVLYFCLDLRLTVGGASRFCAAGRARRPTRQTYSHRPHLYDKPSHDLSGQRAENLLAPPTPCARPPAPPALPALPAARPVKVHAGVRRGPARGPLKTNPARRWAYSSRPSRLTKFRGAQPSSRLCCVTANVRLVPHHAGASSSWARPRTSCSSC